MDVSELNVKQKKKKKIHRECIRKALDLAEWYNALSMLLHKIEDLIPVVSTM